jgi:phosphoenolpyruvate carboxykinase (ATP)
MSMNGLHVKTDQSETPSGTSGFELGLQALGLRPAQIHANLSPAALVEMAVRRGEGQLTETGALNALTGDRTGRSPKDRFIVPDAARADDISWGSVNQRMAPATFDRLLEKILAHFDGRELFVQDGAACADPAYRLPVRVVAEKAWHALFAHDLLLRLSVEDHLHFKPDLTILNACELRADPSRDQTASDVFIALNLERRLVLIGGTHYAGEMKKSVFSYLNYALPRQGVFPMHCAANMGIDGDIALFFGLSGTGKTTLSADPERRLIGDDEHGWSDQGVFNVECGCYAKTIRLSKLGEPEIWNAIRFVCVLENVVIDSQSHRPQFDDDSFTENTRAAYPVDFIDNCEASGRGNHPRNIFFLTCDAFGVLPPISRLSSNQALFHFLLGYTAKVAGTETGITEPKATFSTCFAAPFLPLYPQRYAEMLRANLETHGSTVWLVNTGWTGGPYGRGSRMKLSVTRALLRAALRGELSQVPFIPDPVFGLQMPGSCPGVPAELLNPGVTWPDRAEYDRQAQQLADLFQQNFAAYAARVQEGVWKAGPPR